jgi:hypothetical protein
LVGAHSGHTRFGIPERLVDPASILPSAGIAARSAASID